MTVHVVVDLGYGDAGKGTITDYLVRKNNAKLVVRYNGGAQAAHNVVTDDGNHHTFAQFGSGTLAGAKTYLSSDVLVNPVALFMEDMTLGTRGWLGPKTDLRQVAIHANCLITTPWHVAVNRIKEAAKGDHGLSTCGMGIGETVADSEKKVFAIRARHTHMWSDAFFKMMCQQLQARKFREVLHLIDKVDPELVRPLTDSEEPAAFVDICKSIWERAVIVWDERAFIKESTLSGNVVFEGAQGVLIDQDLGLGAPEYATWSRTTTENADRLLTGYFGEVQRIGVIRPYMVRHGKGPLATEDNQLMMAIKSVEEHNKTNRWQGALRCGWLNLEEIRYAISQCSKIDQIALTCLDHLVDADYYGAYVVNTSGERVPVLLEDLVDFVEKELEIPITIESWGPRAQDKTERVTQLV